MAHELTIRADGVVEMAYLEGVERWHGLGNELQPGADVESWIKAAGMNWSAQRARVRYYTEPGSAGLVEYPNQVALFRSDTKAPLGIVSDRFERVQPRDVMEFWRDLTGEAGMTLQTAGTLYGGRKLWALAKVGEAAILDPRNMVRSNLLLATALDGSMATEAFYCSTVVVCNNTLRGAQGEGTPKVRVPHSTKFDARRVKQQLGIEAAQSAFDRTIAAMRGLAEKRMRESDVVEATARLFKPDYDELAQDERVKAWDESRVKTVAGMALDNTVIGNEFDGMRGTAWGWLNSVTEYVDHGARTKTPDHRFDAAMFGRGAELKERAYALAVEYKPSLADVISATNAVFDKPTSGESLLNAVLAETIL